MRDTIARLRGALFRVWARLFRRNVIAGPGLSIYRNFRCQGQGTVRIGRNCRIDGIRGDDSQYVCLDTFAPEATISIGDNVRLYAARVAAKYRIVIKDDCLVEEAGIVDTDFHSIDRGRQPPTNESVESCGITVGNRVCIGARSLVTKGVEIGDEAVVAPGTIVSSSVLPGSFVSGNPARCAGPLTARDCGEGAPPRERDNAPPRPS